MSLPIHVAPVNDTPAAYAQAVPAREDTALDIQLNGFDVEGQPLTFTIDELKRLYAAARDDGSRSLPPALGG